MQGQGVQEVERMKPKYKPLIIESPEVTNIEIVRKVKEYLNKNEVTR